MIIKTTDAAAVTTAVAQYADQILNLNVDEWLAGMGNIALTNDVGDVSMFERQWVLPKTVSGHYFFFSRGKEAKAVAKEMLREIFTGPYHVETITGLTPVEHKGALWLNKQLGFKEHGEIETQAGPHVFVLLTKAEWEKNENE